MLTLFTISWSAKLGYFEDKFVEHFLVHPERVKKKGPILHKGYYTRFKRPYETLLLNIRVSGIRNLIDQFISSGGKQIVSLGAGFDTNYFVIKVNISNEQTEY